MNYNDLPASDDQFVNPVPTDEELAEPTDEELGTAELEGIGVDPSRLITIRSTSGTSRYVIADEPITFGEAMLRANLVVNGSYEVYMDGNVITSTTLVPLGATITVVGNVKGA